MLERDIEMALVKRIKALGGELFVGGPEAAEKFLRDQQQLWSRVVRERNVKPE